MERMVEKMMKNFFDGLSKEEKQEMMKMFMSQMMTSIPILDVLKNIPMFRFMEKMVEEMEKEDFKPWKTCRVIENFLQELARTHREILGVLKKGLESD